MILHAASPAPTNVRAHLFLYDIPTNSKYPNPSGLLWRLGIRANLSVWVIPDRNVVRLPIEEMKRAGARVELVRFDERDGETILRLARESIAKEVNGLRDSLKLAVQLAEDKYKGVATGDEAGIKKVHGYGYRYLRQSKQFLVAAQEAALAFDLMGDLNDLFNGFRACIQTEEASIFAMRDKAMGKAVPQAAPQLEASCN